VGIGEHFSPYSVTEQSLIPGSDFQLPLVIQKEFSDKMKKN
jgi:hypothetical protein